MFKHKALPDDISVDTLIGKQTVIHGDLHFRGGLYIEGRVVGRLIAEEGADARLTLADGGHIEGEVRAPVVVINGRLDGDVHAGERVELAPRRALLATCITKWSRCPPARCSPGA